MAEFSTNPRTARVDMTPMVDLGFLLITFFMFTATFNLPVVMKLVLPKNEGPTSNLIEGNTLTLVLGKEDKIFWHQKNIKAISENDFSEVNFGIELRKLILEKRKNAKNAAKFTVIIHPTDESNYKNVVDVLDEMTITKQEIYALSDLFPREKEIYQAILK